jgi:hypothetical protein
VGVGMSPPPATGVPLFPMAAAPLTTAGGRSTAPYWNRDSVGHRAGRPCKGVFGPEPSYGVEPNATNLLTQRETREGGVRAVRTVFLRATLGRSRGRVRLGGS